MLSFEKRGVSIAPSAIVSRPDWARRYERGGEAEGCRLDVDPNSGRDRAGPSTVRAGGFVSALWILDARRKRVGHSVVVSCYPPSEMSPPIQSAAVRAYYRSALTGLRFAEERSPTTRRFGDEADALWKRYAGGLTTADRMDLLLRDADGEWPGAFGARATFGLRAVAEDEAFGPEWESVSSMDGESIWRDVAKAGAPVDADRVIERVAEAWGIELASFDVPQLGATTTVLATGASAIAALIRRFAQSPDLDWTRQVSVLSDRAVERQLGAMAAALLNTTEGSRLFCAVEEAGDARFDVLVASEDADPAAVEQAQSLIR